MANDKVKQIEARPARGETRAERPKRVPINGDRDILAVHGIKPDMHPCWVNSYNVQRFLDGGYAFVDYDVTFGSHHVNQGNSVGARYARDVGQGVVAYLMEIPKEFYDEDREREAQDLRESEGSIQGDARAMGLDHGDLRITR